MSSAYLPTCWLSLLGGDGDLLILCFYFIITYRCVLNEDMHMHCQKLAAVSNPYHLVHILFTFQTMLHGWNHFGKQPSWDVNYSPLTALLLISIPCLSDLHLLTLITHGLLWCRHLNYGGSGNRPGGNFCQPLLSMLSLKSQAIGCLGVKWMVLLP